MSDLNQEGVLRRLSESIPGAAIESTVPIVKAKHPTVRQIATGSLIWIADRHFLVTASHVLDEALSSASTLGIDGGVARRKKRQDDYRNGS